MSRQIAEETTLILLRHGESIWNRKNLFTGWVDVPLSSRGIEQALAMRETLLPLSFQAVFTSNLIRAQMTALLAMSGREEDLIVYKKEDPRLLARAEEDRVKQLPLFCHEALNERMYGVLQGLDKKKAALQYGADTIQRWRRSFREKPPGGESLEMTQQRVLPYFQEVILPWIEKREEPKRVLIVAHGNSLRAIVMHLEALSEEEVLHLEIGVGEPRSYTYKSGSEGDRWALV